jgi:hypothetical protein
VLIDVGERLKAKCPTCGIEGFLEQRGNRYRIKHYAGYVGNQRMYLIHSVNKEFNPILGINGNQTLGTNKPKLSLNECGGWDSNPRRPSPEDLKSSPLS